MVTGASRARARALLRVGSVVAVTLVVAACQPTVPAGGATKAAATPSSHRTVVCRPPQGNKALSNKGVRSRTVALNTGDYRIDIPICSGAPDVPGVKW